MDKSPQFDRFPRALSPPDRVFGASAAIRRYKGDDPVRIIHNRLITGIEALGSLPMCACSTEIRLVHHNGKAACPSRLFGPAVRPLGPAANNYRARWQLGDAPFD